MKQIKFLAFALFAVAITNAQVGIGTTSPDASAVLELKTSDKGLLIPRLTTTEITAIASPAEGLIVYNVTEKCIQVNVGDAITRDFECLGAGGDGGSGSTTASGVYSCGEPFVTVVEPIVSTVTGRTWMDRNLGASQRATSLTDPLARGFLYQWGRATDCHQLRDSGMTPRNDDIHTGATVETINMIANDGDGKVDLNWTTLANTESILWQGLTGTNNPCPTDYRIPTEAEFTAEIFNIAYLGGTSSSADAITGPDDALTKFGFLYTGTRSEIVSSNSKDPIIDFETTSGDYWTSTASKGEGDKAERTEVRVFRVGPEFGTMIGESIESFPVVGNPVRCIKN